MSTRIAAGALLAVVAVAAAARPPAPAVERWRGLVVDQVVVVWGTDRYAALTGAQIERESSGNPNAKSPAGACGLMQIMPATGRELQQRYKRIRGHCRDPTWSVAMGVRYTYVMHRTQARTTSVRCEQWRRAFGAYNYGPGNMRRLLRKYGGDWLRHAPKETRGYMAILEREGAFIKAGWPGTKTCEG